LLAISKYDAGEPRSWIEEHGWSFSVLCGGAAVIERYGLTNLGTSREEIKEIPHPATIIADKAGVIRSINVWVNYRKRTSPTKILEELKRIQ
jgi:peroxiredoxin